MAFANRVDKVFGSLGAGSSPWRLREQQQDSSKKPRSEMAPSDEDGDDDEPALEAEEDDDLELPSAPSSFRQFQFPKDPLSMDAEEDPEEEGLQMRSIVGLDTTLDFEAEEDEFDKTAIGREADKERLFMSEINEANANYESSGFLPRSLDDLKHVPRDPRANHLAAKARLEEDAKFAASLRDSRKMNIAEHTKIAVAQETKVDIIPCLKRRIDTEDESSIVSQKPSEAPLEKKENVNGENNRTVKRVRFAVDISVPTTKETEFIRPKPSSQFASQVPDYVRNPSKYTHYTLDWSVEDNEQTNVAAFRACFESSRENQRLESDDTEGMLGRIQYIPRVPKVVEDSQKINLEEAEQTVVHINRTTMCINQFEKESETITELGMGTENAVDSYDASNGKMTKAVRRYRLKRDAEIEMELDSPK